MSRLIGTLLVLAVCLHSHFVFSSPIDGSKLFASSTYSNLKMSPDGKYISAVYRDHKRHNIGLIDIDKNTIDLEINLGLDGRLLSYNWLNSTQLMLVGKYENFTAILIGTIKEKKVDLKILETKGYLVDVLSENEDNILFAKRRSGGVHDLFSISIADLILDDFDNATKIEHDDKKVSYYFYDELSDRIITRKYDSESKTLTFKAIPKTGGKWRTILKKKIDDIEFEVVAMLDANHLAVLTNEQTDKVSLYKYNIDSQELEELVYQHPNYDLKGAAYTKGGELSYVQYEELGLLRSEFFNPVSKTINARLSKTFDGLEYFLVDIDKANKRSILKVRGADLPGEYLVFDNKTSKLTRLLLSFPDLEERKLYKSKAFITKSSDGIDIEAFLTSPNKNFDLSTLLVMPHGGPIGVKDDDRFNPLVQYFVSRGFSVLRVNFRGSEGYGKGFQEKGVGEFGKLIEEDITSVVNRVISDYQYDHICSIGGSYGGYSAVMLAIKHPSTYKCVVGGFGIYDLPLLFNHDNHISQDKNRSKVERVVGKYSPALKELSPVYFAEKLKAPILLTAGVEDETAVFEHTYRFAYMLKKLGKSVETLYYEDTGHGHDYWSGYRHEAAISYDFLVRTLGLEYPNSNTISEAARGALAEDFSIIADKYIFNDRVENDEAKAFQFYERAAEYGEARSNFNVGAHYHRGDQVEVNIEKAVSYYQRAAELGHASAHRRLGRMYMEGEYFDLDWSKAKEHLEKALNLDDTAKNYLTLARLDCTAPEQYKNIRRCLNILDLKRFKKRSKASHKRAVRSLREISPWIIAETQFTDKERKEFEGVLNSALKLNGMEAELESIRIGAFNFVEGIGFGKKDVYESLSEGALLTPSDDENHSFGVIFDVDVPGVDRGYDQVGVAARWTKTMKNGTKNYLSATVLYGSPQGEWRLLKRFDEFDDGESVKLEIFDLKGRPLLTKTFKVTNS